MMGAPRAALFWVACEQRLRANNRKPNASESAFVFDKLLETEARLPVTHFCASDGSRLDRDKEGKPIEPQLGRVILAHDGATMQMLGGSLSHERRGHECHSLETELAGFHDHLAATEDTVTVIVTDCLSGSLAGDRWRSRSHSDKGGRYRSHELDNLEALEQKHRAVVYLWVHSHVGITPNEAADAECDLMRTAPLAEIDLAPSRFQLVRVEGLKRGVGPATFEWAEARLLGMLMGATDHTLFPSSATWRVMANARKEQVMRETDCDTLEDARANRCGLMADRLLEDRLTPGEQHQCDKDAESFLGRRRAYRPRRGSWEDFRQRCCSCPACGRQPCPTTTTVAGLRPPSHVRQPPPRMSALGPPPRTEAGTQRRNDLERQTSGRVPTLDFLSDPTYSTIRRTYTATHGKGWWNVDGILYSFEAECRLAASSTPVPPPSPPPPPPPCTETGTQCRSDLERQTTWHVLTECSAVGTAAAQHRAEAAGWLARKVGGFSGSQADYALTAITGGSKQLSEAQRDSALRFLLGLADREEDKEESPAVGRALALGYGRYFCRRMANLLREAAMARARLVEGSRLQGLRLELLPRAEWMKRRGLRETWENGEMVRKCFRALSARALRKSETVELPEAIQSWRLREAFGRLRAQLGDDPRIAPDKCDTQFLFGVINDEATRPGLALVRLRHAEGGPAEQARQRREAAALLITVRERARAARGRARLLRAQRKAEEAAEREEERSQRAMAAMRKRGRASFAGLMQKLVRDGERDERTRATRRATDFMRRELAKRKRGQQTGGRHGQRSVSAKVDEMRVRGRASFSGLMQKLVRDGEREERARATRRATEFIRAAVAKKRRERRSGQGGAPQDDDAEFDATRRQGRCAFAGRMRRLVKRPERGASGRATSLVLHLIRRRRQAAANGAEVYRKLVDPDQGGGSSAAHPNRQLGQPAKRLRQEDDDAEALAFRRRRVKRKRAQPEDAQGTGRPQGNSAGGGALAAFTSGPAQVSARLQCPLGHALLWLSRGSPKCVGGRDCDVPGCSRPGLAAGDARFSCATCGFDACGLCEARSGGDADGSGGAARSKRTRTGVKPFHEG